MSACGGSTHSPPAASPIASKDAPEAAAAGITQTKPTASTPAAPTPTKIPASASPTISPSPTITPTPTLLPGPAPSMEPIGVHFIEHGDREKPLVALTFDLCQAPTNPSGFDQGIYAALVEAGAPATFFVSGDWARTHPEETRQLAAVPLFELGNHSWSHPDFRELEELDMSLEILRTQTMLYQLTGSQPALFRFPAGTYNALALSVAAWHGLRAIQWDVVTADPVPDNTAEMILARVQDQVQNGSIIIMHANGRGWHTAAALPGMISYLRAEGYCLVTVSQLLGLKPLPDGCPVSSPKSAK
jgi:peptidoglycan/xylan/chitin deacetylase (PgdA/CDA1 family)